MQEQVTIDTSTLEILSAAASALLNGDRFGPTDDELGSALEIAHAALDSARLPENQEGA